MKSYSFALFRYKDFYTGSKKKIIVAKGQPTFSFMHDECTNDLNLNCPLMILHSLHISQATILGYADSHIPRMCPLKNAKWVSCNSEIYMHS